MHQDTAEMSLLNPVARKRRTPTKRFLMLQTKKKFIFQMKHYGLMNKTINRKQSRLPLLWFFLIVSPHQLWAQCNYSYSLKRQTQLSHSYYLSATTVLKFRNKITFTIQRIIFSNYFSYGQVEKTVPIYACLCKTA